MNDKWLFQLKKGSFELAVLLLLKNKPMYGYEITQRLKETNELSIEGGAIYPVLKRMTSNNLINFFWEESDKGPKKKYYYVNEKGLQTLEERMEIYKSVYKALSTLAEES